MLCALPALELNDCKAWFGFCGDPKALAVDLRFGYELTKHDKIIVKWFAPLLAAEKEQLIDSIATIGPF